MNERTIEHEPFPLSSRRGAGKPLCGSPPTPASARRPGAGRRTILLAALLSLIVLPAIISREAGESFGRVAPQETPSAPVDLVVVPEGEDWLVSLAAPVVERLAREQKATAPLLLVMPSAPRPSLQETYERIPWRRALALYRTGRPYLPGTARGREVSWVKVPMDPEAASRSLANRFWKRTDLAVVASLRDPAGTVLAATLAAHEGRPLLLHQELPSELRRLDQGLTALGAQSVFGVRSAPIVDGPDWRNSLSRAVLRMSAGETAARIQELLGPKDSKTVVLARIPSLDPGTGDLAWLAPHWSVVRGAPVVLVDSPDPLKAEAAVYAYLKRHRISPRSLTILATSYSIDLESFSIETTEGGTDLGYSFLIEPCSLPKGAGAAALGVGRIPSPSLGEASLIFAGGRLREFLETARTVLIANAGFADGSSLPLCETVSRTTAAELRNARIHVDEFNRKVTDDPGIMRAVESAQLVLYQGHSIDNRLFPDPLELPPLPLPDDLAGLGDPEPIVKEAPPRAPPSGPPLKGRPILFLQSCSSLQGGIADRAFASGAVGLIGSVTSIHSASGSTFAKALVDGGLVRGATVGEALRDARNYYLTLIELKNRRGHSQQAKALRVAMSFRLWGDPELALLPGIRPKPLLPRVSARWTSDGRIKVALPKDRLPFCRTEDYLAHFLPGSEAAGLVKRVPDSDVRALLPFYFFRLPVPAEFEKKGYTVVRRKGGKTNRGAFFTDRLGRFLYVVYLPSKEKPGESFTLRFE